ncbi:MULTISPECIES: hypothetical protein [Subtercola]|uniref:hypothetical protein n=1 Tax=Subtercola TaxID=120212 RepID=UPI0010A9E253|nr:MULTISPECIES: hypothetical protein [Subtercola]
MPSPPVPPEPFAWMSKNDPAGRFKITLKSPASEAVTGTLLIVAGILFAALLLADASGVTIALAVGLFIIFAGFGVLLLVMAVARRRWMKAYAHGNGHPPSLG